MLVTTLQEFRELKMRPVCVLPTLLFSWTVLLWNPTFGDERLRFGSDVLPILSANCFACHGPDESVRKAGLRLDLESDAKAPHDTGIPIVPGDPDSSTIVRRIRSRDPDLIMPPADSHKTLNAEQIATLIHWIETGAEWGDHWSFEPLRRPDVPADISGSAIDFLVERSLRRRGLALRPPADPHQLVRRLWLDLIGLPPEPTVADKFAGNPTDEAWEELIDELLQRPEFGEHWARMWMDLARYADTKGYEKDLGRTMWPYRDWLVSALNSDMPLDQMTIEQLAGDLFPNASESRLTASAFHRNTMSNDEGGTDDEEFRTIAVKDRVDTTMQVWMGLTAGCAKCHTHKYDPISQHEYYGLYAVFNQTEDADRYDDAPTMELIAGPAGEQKSAVESRIRTLKEQVAAIEASGSLPDNSDWNVIRVTNASSANGAKLTSRENGDVSSSGTSPAEDVYTVIGVLRSGRHTVLSLEARPEKFPDGQLGVGRNPRDPNFVLSELEVEVEFPDGFRPVRLTDPRADFEQTGWPVTAAVDGNPKTGWAVSPRQRESHIALFSFSEPLELADDAVVRIVMRQHYGDSLTLRRFRLATTSADASGVRIPEKSPEMRRLTDELAAANRELQEINSRIPRLPIMRELAADKRRTTKIHRRGNFLDPGESVSPGIPAAFRSFYTPEDELNRLAIAQWLMHPENPLTARVWANRIWSRLFGTGIVETEEDFGTLGTPPSNQELLDWLAVEYRDGGWSLRQLLKTITMTRTWRQSSEVTPELHEADPRNTFWSRGARYRLSAETIRDQSLAVAGLLSLKKGGPPVMPPQPDGLWRSTYNGQKWINAEGEDRFRRALYTYMKRTTPYPTMTTFDGGSGEVCQIRRIRTNTPLQALVTLNDPVFVEAAGALAGKMAAGGENGIEQGLRLALIRPARNAEIDLLQQLFDDASTAFRNDPDSADELLRSARATTPDGLSHHEFAALVVVANTILNLDEFLTRN